MHCCYSACSAFNTRRLALVVYACTVAHRAANTAATAGTCSHCPQHHVPALRTWPAQTVTNQTLFCHHCTAILSLCTRTTVLHLVLVFRMLHVLIAIKWIPRFAEILSNISKLFGT
jgi:hypothetical protein